MWHVLVFPRGSANPKTAFAFLPRQISSLLWPWQVLQRRNVLTRNDAQQSLESHREQWNFQPEREHSLLPTSVFAVNRYSFYTALPIEGGVVSC